MASAPLRNREDVLRAAAADGAADLPDSTYDAVARTARRTPDAVALSFFLHAADHHKCLRWTYAQLLGDVHRFANMLYDMGIGEGDVVALLLPNLPETHIAIWGGEAAGIVMPVNPMLDPEALGRLLATAKAKVLITVAPFAGIDLYEKATAFAGDVPSLQHVVLIDLADHVVGWRKPAARLMAWRARRSACPFPPGVRIRRWRAAMRRQPDSRLVSRRAIKSEDIASYFCTGGTTGLPKIAMRTHGNEVANGWQAGRMLGDALEEGTILLCGLPLFHVNAVIATGLTPFMRGAQVLLATPQGYRGPGLIARFWEIVAAHRITAFSGVPTLFATLLDQTSTGHDLSSFRYAFSGAAPMPVELMRRFEQEANVTIVEAYGLTEATCISTMNPLTGERRVGSVGLALPGQDIAIVQLDEEGRVARRMCIDDVGTVAIAGPNVFQGYLSEAHNAGLWIDCGDGRRWLNTGDLGRIDADGYLWLAGRSKDLIIRGGHNIDPAIVEDALQDHPCVALSAAIGRPDAHAGEVPVAYVQLRPGTSVTTDALLDHAAARISERAAIPKTIYIMDALPMTGVGKIFKPTLRHMETERVVHAVLAQAGIEPAEVQVRSDPKSGTVVAVTSRPEHEQDIRQALTAFSFSTIFESRGS